ncbi:MAG: hypothetical protein J7545_06660 [Roseofilum sp. SBFL]|uniref:hypothetical protein n=1 Tax=unclassified Roseofilum TaxID=2620099 RepID=UPI001B1D71F8|nr:MULTISPECIES: hypothetical protein [unclassified Roseofilum]MBP0012276.1 hypothetical protein [Roseofilum sp. SID3]MBP0022902.1 hypothetical protein [Roseofilum sp. SID2]MBP0037174.1 hypothetical protein [Roseofilum sp. SID1]MBP0041640.1 hypothetical protein [Roseofilum sp. SBFL]
MVEPITTFLIGKWIISHLGIHAASAATVTAVGAGAVVAAAATVVYISYLTFSALINWFQKDEVASVATQEQNVAASFKEKLDSGENVLVQGVFNKNTGHVVKSRMIRYDRLDSKTQDLHSGGRMPIYN